MPPRSWRLCSRNGNLLASSDLPIEIRIDLAEVAYDDLGALPNTRSPSPADIRELNESGKLTTLLSRSAMIGSGDCLTVAGPLDEVIYPERLAIEAAQTNWAGAAEDKKLVMFPLSFETQVVGAECEVCPRYQADGTEINVHLSAKVVSPPVWGQVGGEIPIMNGRGANVPVVHFHTRSVTTNLVLKEGTPAIVFGGMDLDGSVLYSSSNLKNVSEHE